jgi:MEMO1 family protein
MIREPVVAGQFYPSEAGQLMQELALAFRNVPEYKGRKLKGIISPHAGISFSGHTAACGYRALADCAGYDAFMILGFSHSGYAPDDLMLSALDWRTPLGVARNSPELRALLQAAGAVVDEKVHAQEHSIEVQIPFLQYVFKDPVIVPVSVAWGIDAEKHGKGLAVALRKSKMKVCVIASSDFTHYGAGYGYVPFKDKVPERIKALDMAALLHLKRFDHSGFLEYLEKTGATICGAGPLALLVSVLKEMGAEEGIVLDYLRSGDITGEYSQSVSYASVIFR